MALVQDTQQKEVRIGLFSIRNRLILAVALSIVIPALISSYVIVQNEQRTLEAELAEELQLLSATEAELIETILINQLDLLFNLANLSEVELFTQGAGLGYEGTPEEITAQLLELDEQWRNVPDNDPLVIPVLSNLVTTNLNAFLENIPGHTELIMTDIFGATIASTSRTTDYYQADELWWQEAINDGQDDIYISETFVFDESIGQNVVIIALPIERNNEIYGVLRSNYTVAQIEAVLEDALIGTTGRVKLMRDDGQVIASSDDAPLEIILDDIAATFDDKLDADGPVLSSAIDENGESVLVSSTLINTNGTDPVIDGLGWHVAYLQLEAEALAPITETLRTTIITEIIILAVGVFIAYFFSRLLTNPLAKLTDAAREIALEKNWSRRVAVQGNTEFGVLASAFNQLAQEVQTTLRTLEARVSERTRELQTVADVSAQAATILNQDRLLQDMADLTKERFGLYHAHIYLLDETGEILQLAAGAGHVGRQMVSEERTIPYSSDHSIVARAAQTRRGQIVNDVSISPNFLPHPALPDTQSELAVPLIARGEVIGVLDVQNDELNTFTPELLGVMELLANQLATALSNARLFERAQQTSRHEAALGSIDRQLQRADSVDEILQVAIRELGKALRVPHAAIELQLESAAITEPQPYGYPQTQDDHGVTPQNGEAAQPSEAAIKPTAAHQDEPRLDEPRLDEPRLDEITSG